ncbi:MAG TPA: hypothetical protein VMW89_14780 [Desulfatiglandales bacterium]|nr:hypothetical protein [Desulfatiglandales bacterium]
MKTVHVHPWGGVLKVKYSSSAIIFLQELEILEYLIFYLLVSDRVFYARYENFREESLDYIKSLGPKFKETFDQIVVSKADRLLFRSKTYENLLSQMAYSRSVDNFILYLKNILAEIIEVKPQLLKSGEKERLDYILNFDDIVELRRALADKKIESLFYSGFKDIFEFYESRIGIKLSDKTDDIEKFILMTKIRNLIVHNGGKINSEFKKAFPKYPFEVGESLKLSFKEILEDNYFILRSVDSIDSKITGKFGLSLVPVKNSN